MQEAEIKEVLHDIINSIRNKGDSFSQCIHLLQNKKADYQQFICDHSFELTATASIDEGLFCESLGINASEERLNFIDLVAKINLTTIKYIEPKVFIEKFNKGMTEKSITFVAEDGNLTPLKTIIEKIILLEKAKMLIRVCECWEEYMDILAYCKHFFDMTSQQVLSEVSLLVTGYTDLKVLIINEEEAREKATEILSKVGHIKEMVADKTAGEMMTIVERMINAGNAVLSCKKKVEKTNFSKDELIDEIARYWLDEEAKILQNTTEYIVPPPPGAVID